MFRTEMKEYTNYIYSIIRNSANNLKIEDIEEKNEIIIKELDKMKEEEIEKIIEKSRKKIAISQLKREEKNMTKRNLFKLVASLIVYIGITFGMVYAGFQLETLFKIKGMNDKGIQTALENQYVQNIDMNYMVFYLENGQNY